MYKSEISILSIYLTVLVLIQCTHKENYLFYFSVLITNTYVSVLNVINNIAAKIC